MSLTFLIKSTKKIYLMFLLTMVLYACNKRHPYTIVFCDFTSSIDSVNSINKLKQDALAILSEEGANAVIDFYSINKNYNSPCLFTNNPLKSDPKPSERAEFKKGLLKKRDSLSRILDSVSSSAFVNRKEPNSCIIDCLEKAITYFQNYEGYESVPLKLYLLSDMLECCSGYGKPFLCIENNDNITKEIALMDSITSTKYSFKKFPNLKIYIVLISSQGNKNSNVSFKRFWQPVFKHFGYDSLPYHKPTLPFAP